MFVRICLFLPVILSCAAAPGQGVPVTLQWFETSWRTMEDRTADAFMAGYQRVWTPPISKADGGATTGFDVFDRFDLGSPEAPTRYGTQAGFAAVVTEQDRAAIGTFVDLILNHNGFRDNNTPGFEAQGDYPGFVLTAPGAPFGDFHAPGPSCDSDPVNCRISGLIDIAPESNHLYIRHPIDAGHPQNIPAGSLYDKPDAANRRFYPDLSLPANAIGIHPFNLADPSAGDAVAENATGLLLRNVRWLLEVVGVDGFRIDAAKHLPDWVLRDFYDRHVWQRGKPSLTGGATTPYSFMELFDGSLAYHAGYVCKNGQGNCNTSGGVSGNRDSLDFPLYFALRDMINADGFGNWSSVVNASVDGMFDGNANDGDFGVTFAEAHDESVPPPELDNLAYAYLLTRSGSPLVYYQPFGCGTPCFPRPGRGDALGGPSGATITTLVDIHNEYVRGAYLERWIDGDVLIFERSNACLVGLNDQRSGGYDTRTVQTSFAADTRLKELSGNAVDPDVDPMNDIFDVVTVQPDGKVTIRVPRNRSVTNVEHKKGYVVYGPFNPDGDLSLTNVATTLPPDPGPGEPGEVPNGLRRLTPIEVIQADSFEVRLETTDADAGGDGEDDLAMLRLDAGMDLNGNGQVDALDPSFVGYGYEDFLTQKVTLKSGGVEIGGVQKGLYRQAIDATGLADGRHYLSVIAFRSRPVNSPPIFETWRKVILLDRGPPAMALAAPSPGQPITSTLATISVRCLDRTATRVHLFLDQPPGTDVAELANSAGQPGLATAHDRDQFRRVFTGLTAGRHRLDVVAFESTRPDAGVTTFAGIQVIIGGNDGMGDLTGDGRADNRDIFPFVNLLQAGNQFHPGADFNGDGVVEAGDVDGFIEKLTGQGTPHALLAPLRETGGPPAVEAGHD